MSRTSPEQSWLLDRIEQRRRASSKGDEIWTEVQSDRISIGGYRLETVLSSLEQKLGPDARILHTERQIIGGVRGFFGREAFVVQAALPEAALSEVTLPETELPEASPTEAALTTDSHQDGPSFAKALAEALEAVEQFDFVEPVATVSGSTSAPGIRSDAAFLTLEAADLSDEALADQVSAMMKPVAPLPERGVVAVVGDPDDSVAAARELAIGAGIDPGEVPVLSPVPVAGVPAWMCVRSAEDRSRRLNRWANDNRLHIVAIALSAGSTGMEWACSSLDALSPLQTRLAVPGWRRADELLGRLRSLAPVSAIDVVGEVDRETVVGLLDLDVPVATIAGETASVERWCSFLAQAQPITASTRWETLR